MEAPGRTELDEINTVLLDTSLPFPASPSAAHGDTASMNVSER